MYARHFEAAAQITGSTEDVFAYLDNHSRLSGHMSNPSWRTAGMSMTIEVDDLGGRVVGSRIRILGKVLGLRLFVEQAVTKREPGVRKEWETLGEPRLLVIAGYRMGFEVAGESGSCALRVFIDYNLPAAGVSRLLGLVLGDWYARWCVRSMVSDAQRWSAASTSSSSDDRRSAPVL
jgi:hypothetical protein